MLTKLDFIYNAFGFLIIKFSKDKQINNLKIYFFFFFVKVYIYSGLTGILLPMWQLEQVVNIGDNKVLVYKIIH